jgi:hypothetical protein
MPKKASPHEIFCAALYTLTGGKNKGLMVTTMANQLGIGFQEAEVLAVGCAERGWLDHQIHTVVLRSEGYAAARRVLGPSADDQAAANQATADIRPSAIAPGLRRCPRFATSAIIAGSSSSPQLEVPI